MISSMGLRPPKPGRLGGGARVSERDGVAATPARRKAKHPSRIFVAVQSDGTGGHAQGIGRQHDVRPTKIAMWNSPAER